MRKYNNYNLTNVKNIYHKFKIKRYWDIIRNYVKNFKFSKKKKKIRKNTEYLKNKKIIVGSRRVWIIE